ncbi:MAG: hypothetical protein RR313_11055 [Anaerovoracaceae bacterium]
MFKEKVEITFKKKANLTRTINGKDFKVAQFLSDSDVANIVGLCVEHYNKLFDTEDLVTTTVSTIAQMETLISVYATNLKLDGVSYGDISACGLVKIIQEDVANYSAIKSAVLMAVNTLNVDRLVKALSNIATTEELEKSSNDMKEMLEKNPEQAEKFMKIAFANNPALVKMIGEKEE